MHSSGSSSMLAVWKDMVECAGQSVWETEGRDSENDCWATVCWCVKETMQKGTQNSKFKLQREITARQARRPLHTYVRTQIHILAES